MVEDVTQRNEFLSNFRKQGSHSSLLVVDVIPATGITPSASANIPEQLINFSNFINSPDHYFGIGNPKYKKVKTFYKKQKGRLIGGKVNYGSLEELDVNVEGGMEFGMEVNPGLIGERVAFGPMAKTQKRYGSTSSRWLRRDEPQGFPYTVQRGDTLQGLAVKFGVSTEQIRRFNQLWTNDSLFLRDKLIIPNQLENMTEGASTCSSILTSPSSSVSSVERRGNVQSTMTTTNGSSTSSKSHKKCSSSSIQLTSSSGISSPPEDSEGLSSNTTGNNNKPWTHPLSDSFEYDDGLISPDSIKLSSESITSLNSVTENLSPHSYVNHNSYQNGDENKPSCIANTENRVSSGQLSQDKAQSSSRPYVVRDQSEKSVDEFLSRIDSSIASTREKALPLKQKALHWVTFESDSESERRSVDGGSPLLTNGRQLRYSLRKLEKKQDELFQL